MEPNLMIGNESKSCSHSNSFSHRHLRSAQCNHSPAGESARGPLKHRSKIDEEALILDLQNKDVTRADGRNT
jgi:hypothetical protein